MRGVSVVDAERVWVSGVGGQVRGQARVLLEKGVAGLNQSETAAALQVRERARGG